MLACFLFASYNINIIIKTTFVLRLRTTDSWQNNFTKKPLSTQPKSFSLFSQATITEICTIGGSTDIHIHCFYTHQYVNLHKLFIKSLVKNQWICKPGQFSGPVFSKGGLLHTPQRIPTSMAIFLLSSKTNTLLTLCHTILSDFCLTGSSFSIAENAYQFQPTTFVCFLEKIY